MKRNAVNKRGICVAVVGLRGIPDVQGGIESHVAAIYGRMKALDPGARLLVTARRPYVPCKPYRYAGVVVLPIWALKNKYLETILHTFFALVVLRLRVRPDVVHIHAIGPGLMAPLARLLGMRVVFTHHGTDYEREKWGWFAKRVLRLGEQVAIASADETIIVGKSLCNRVREDFPAKAQSIQYVPNGASVPSGPAKGEVRDSRHLDNGVLEELGIRPSQYFLTVGRMVPEKRIHDIIDAHNKLRQNTRPGEVWPMVVVGRADFEDHYSRRIRDIAGSDVIFAGFRTGAELRALYHGAGLFLLASSHEGLPIAGLEAMAAGAPVLLSDIQPNVDIALAEPCYFPLGDTRALADRMGAPDQSVRIAPPDRIAPYDWQRIADQTAATLRLAALRPTPTSPQLEDAPQPLDGGRERSGNNYWTEQ